MGEMVEGWRQKGKSDREIIRIFDPNNNPTLHQILDFFNVDRNVRLSPMAEIPFQTTSTTPQSSATDQNGGDNPSIMHQYTNLESNVALMQQSLQLGVNETETLQTGSRTISEPYNRAQSVAFSDDNAIFAGFGILPHAEVGMPSSFGEIDEHAAEIGIYSNSDLGMEADDFAMDSWYWT
jgi:hypothetical protein